MTHCIVSASDAGYFPLLQNLLLSIAANVRRCDVVAGVVDLGLTRDQADWVRQHCDIYVNDVDWHFGWPCIAKLPDHRKALAARPFLPRYFPGHETLIWIDADAWIQTREAVDLMIEAAADGKLAIVPELSRSYPSAVSRPKVKLLPGGFPRRATTWMRQTFKKRHDRALANETLFQAVYNSGVLAMRPDSVGWKAWEDSFRLQPVKRSADICDQTAINHAIYTHRIPVHPLPARCNWIVDLAVPVWDQQAQCYCEPHLPRTPISILHLLGQSKDRKPVCLDVSGRPVDQDLRFHPTDTGA